MSENIFIFESRRWAGSISKGLATCAAFVFLWVLSPISSGATDDQGDGKATYHFIMIKGRDIPVCDAYLKRLSATRFQQSPHCNIPENDSIPGFGKLNRVSLTADEVVNLWSHIFWFTKTQDQFVASDQWPPENARDLVGRELLAWRYDPPVSLNNDGRPDNVLIWQGYGADDVARQPANR